MQHVIHARLVGETPWGWRDARVVSAAADGHVEIAYLVGGRARLWHHTDLSAELRPGAPIRLHEQYHTLGTPTGWLNVAVLSGLGPVPEPADAGTWAPERTVAVVDLATGRGVPLDHSAPPPYRAPRP